MSRPLLQALIAGHVLGSPPMETKKTMHRMMNNFVLRTLLSIRLSLQWSFQLVRKQ